MNWAQVAAQIRDRAAAPGERLNEGQRGSLRAIATRLDGGANNEVRGVILADEVGLGKTRVASAVAAAVRQAGGRVAVVIPPGLDYQWRRELAGDRLEPPPLLRSLNSFLWPEGGRPLHREGILLISQLFANWQMGKRTPRWRWAFLPLLVAEARKWNGRYPNGRKAFFNDLPWWAQAPVQRAVSRAAGQARQWAHAKRQLEELSVEPWRSTWCEAKEYYQRTDTRKWLEWAVGLGLGRFHLLIVDEAHKAHGESTGLGRLLDHVVHLRHQPARLALTATPVALHVTEWGDTLSRIGLSAEQCEALNIRCTAYAEATERLQGTWRSSNSNRAAWRAAAQDFQRALSPYVLRRDKRSDPDVAWFEEHEVRRGGYRLPRQVTVRPADLDERWKRVVYAAEALSVTVHGGEDPVAKRLRLTLANGHGISTIIDAARADDDERGDSSDADIDSANAKRAERARLWEGLIRRELSRSGQQALWQHPQILAAAEAIEGYLADRQKVLVFGRFTRPMEALTKLVNARARLLVLQEGGVWPQEKLGEPEAIDFFAARQLGIDLDALPALFASHTQRYRAQGLRSLRNKLHQRLEQAPLPSWARSLANEAHKDKGDFTAHLTRALWELMDEPDRAAVREHRESAPQLLGEAFEALMHACLDNDDFDEAARDQAAKEQWPLAKARIVEEFSPQRGGLARLMNGATPHSTRRMLQAAFNRPHSYPQVLVAQSVVGREGLNLHEACRVVMMLHPEWNPGVVEQQIGRVDRLGSRWKQELARARANDGELPRIEMVAVVFEGTYDEHNWRVLRSRWAALKAQLYGVVIPTYGLEGDELDVAVALNAGAPDFSNTEVPC